MLTKRRQRAFTIVALLILATTACAPSDRVTTVVVDNRCSADVWVRFAVRPQASAQEMGQLLARRVPAKRSTRVSDALIHVDDGKRGTISVSDRQDVVGKITALPPDQDEEISVRVENDLCPGESTAG